MKFTYRNYTKIMFILNISITSGDWTCLGMFAETCNISVKTKRNLLLNKKCVLPITHKLSIHNGSPIVGKVFRKIWRLCKLHTKKI